MSGKTPPFFVGWAAVPAPLRRFALTVGALLVAAMVAAGALLPAAFDDPGDGRWAAEAQTLQGVIEHVPYPVLRRPNADGRVETLLLVALGKCSGEDQIADAVGRPAAVRGFPIARGGMGMLELDAGASVEPLSGRPAGWPVDVSLPPAESLGRHTLQGEIVDSKCYLGVMRPGEGVVHRACARLCLLGDIPPVFVVRHGEDWTGYLITDPAGDALRDALLDHVALPVEVSGTVERRGDLLFLRLDPAEIRRLQ